MLMAPALAGCGGPMASAPARSSPLPERRARGRRGVRKRGGMDVDFGSGEGRLRFRGCLFPKLLVVGHVPDY